MADEILLTLKTIGGLFFINHVFFKKPNSKNF